MTEQEAQQILSKAADFCDQHLNTVLKPNDKKAYLNDLNGWLGSKVQQKLPIKKKENEG